ncbi:hypothetical protein GS474_15895 [Rhodococcus hoagii]|nr:hypothetical protein [Prescottella equi]NKR60213.1 hypothetical protein [Prescottella equi]
MTGEEALPTSSTGPVYFMCAPTRPPDEELAVLGIAVEQPHGVIAHRIVRKQLIAEIGKLIVIGSTIHAIPKAGLTARQHAQLIGAATVAFLADCTENPGWEHSIVDGQPRWTTWISVPAEAISATSLAAMSAHLDSADSQTV